MVLYLFGVGLDLGVIYDHCEPCYMMIAIAFLSSPACVMPPNYLPQTVTPRPSAEEEQRNGPGEGHGLCKILATTKNKSTQKHTDTLINKHMQPVIVPIPHISFCHSAEL